MGRIVGKNVMPATKFLFPPNLDTSLFENQTFTVKLIATNLQVFAYPYLITRTSFFSDSPCRRPVISLIPILISWPPLPRWMNTAISLDIHISLSNPFLHWTRPMFPILASLPFSKGLTVSPTKTVFSRPMSPVVYPQAIIVWDLSLRRRIINRLLLL